MNHNSKRKYISFLNLPVKLSFLLRGKSNLVTFYYMDNSKIAKFWIKMDKITVTGLQGRKKNKDDTKGLINFYFLFKNKRFLKELQEEKKKAIKLNLN